VGTLALYAMAKSRWRIENEGINEGKTCHGMERLCHHHPNSLLIGWLLLFLALSLGRLWRLRHMRRGGRMPRTAIDLVRSLRLSLLDRPRCLDTS